MREKLRAILLSRPVITAAGLFALYLLLGFFALPAIVKWQVEKQVPEQLGHSISVGEVRFDPLAFRFEAGDLVLSDADGSPMLGFRRLVVDFELRSVIDRAWTFAEARLEAPMLRFELLEDGRHNFSAMLERLGEGEPAEETGEPTRFVVGQVALNEGRFEFADRLLEEPELVRIEPLSVEIDQLSSLPGQAASYRVSARTTADESFESSGELALNPFASKGRLALGGLKVATLVRGLSRLLALDAPTGNMAFSASFDVGVDSAGALSGAAQEIEFEVASLSLSAAGASAPLLAFETLALNAGRVDLAAREVEFAGFRLRKGSVAASMDEQGRLDWAQLVRAPAASAQTPDSPAIVPPVTVPGSAAAAAAEPAVTGVTAVEQAEEQTSEEMKAEADAASAASTAMQAVATEPTATEPAATEPAATEAPSGGEPVTAPPVAAGPQAEEAVSAAGAWRVSISEVEVSDIALSFTDAAGGAGGTIAAVGLAMAPSAEFGATGARVALAQPKLSIAGVQLDSGADSLGLPAGGIEAARVSIVAAERGFEIVIDAPRITAAEGVSARSGDAALALGGVTLETGRVTADGADTTINGAIDDAKISLVEVSVNAAGDSAKLGDASLEAARLALQSGPQQLDVDLDSLRAALAGLQLRSGGQTLDFGKASLSGARLTLAQGESGLRVVAQSPALAMSGLGAGRAEERAALEALSVEFGSVALSGTDGGLDLALERPRVAATELALSRGDDGLDLGAANLAGDALSLAQGGGQLRFAGRAARVSLSALAARQGAERITLQEASLDAGALSAAVADGTSAAAGMDARLEGAMLRLASVAIVARGASSEIARVGEAKAGADSLALALPEGPADVSGEGLSASLADVVVLAPADAAELLRLGSAELSGGALKLRERTVTVDRIALADGDAKTWLDEDGQFNWVRAFAGEAAVQDAEAVLAVEPVAALAPSVREAEAGATTASSVPGDATAPAWGVAIKSAEVDGFAVGFEDRRMSPAFALGLEATRARLTDAAIGAANGGEAPIQVELQVVLASGGRIEASGAVRADTGASDLKLSISEIALAPVQTYLSEFAALQLASGTVSTEGRLRYGDPEGAGAMLAYEGSIALDRLLLEEIEPKRPFFAWDAVASDDVVLTLEPNGLDIGELRIDRPVGRLIIAEDQTINLTDVLKKPAEGEAAPVQGDAMAADAEAEAGGEVEAEEAPFPVTIARISVSDGLLEFADLSLRPQFGARMHELKGVVTGLGTDPNQSAEVQLDARVDEYGSAKISGQISVLQPERFTEIDMAFRNLEMTSLSPYVVKFAGYRIAGGRLALDLQYRVEESKLLGQNKVVLTQMELGEKVDSPDALDLPLELAIAILKDSKGVIDIGVPVSGDLDNPEFGIGEVIGKAIGNLLGGIVTAPFRALGALFGAGDKPLDTIEFEPGRDTLAPPQREKLAAVARALVERPQLKLVVPPIYAAAEDTPALKLRAVRTDIVERMGVELEPGENPGPIDIANPRVQGAVEAAFSERYSAQVLAALKARAADTAAPASAKPAPPKAVKPESDGAPKPAAPAVAQAPTLPTTFYQGLVDRLIAEQPVSEKMLLALAVRRGEAIVRELTAVGGVPAARVVLGDASKATEASDKAVTLRMELEAAK